MTSGAAPDAVKAARPVLNGEDEETGRKVLRLVLTQRECGKFEVKSHGSLNPSNDCKLLLLTAILPQTSRDLLVVREIRTLRSVGAGGG